MRGWPSDARTRIAVVADARPARGGIATFVELLTGDPELNLRFAIELVNTTRTAVWRGGALSATNLRRALVDAVRVLRAARRNDVVHVQTALLPLLPLVRALLLMAAAKLGGASVICHAHTGLINEGPHERFEPGPVTAVFLRALAGADLVVTVSDAGLRGLSPYVGATPVRRLDNAVDASRFEPSRGETGDGPATVLYIGALGRAKGVLDLVTTAASLRSRDLPPWRLRIVGGPNQRGEEEAALVRAETHRLGFGEALVGETDLAGVRRALSDAAILVLPSHSEGQPLVVLEAMAMAVPVVATRVGGIPEQIRDGIDGLLVPPGDPERLEEALAGLLRDPDRRGRMGERGRRRVLERFDLPAWRERIGALYVEATVR